MSDGTLGKVCTSCKYASTGMCHRYPPTVLVEHHDNGVHKWEIITSRYVEVNDSDWCGEYKDKST